MSARIALLWAIAGACGSPATKPGVAAPASSVSPPACRDAYAEYEARWRVARTEDLVEFVAGDTAVLEEILYSELATLPSRVELAKLREIYAGLDVFLWDAPWPRAFAASDVAIERCGERAARPT